MVEVALIIGHYTREWFIFVDGAWIPSWNILNKNQTNGAEEGGAKSYEKNTDGDTQLCEGQSDEKGEGK